MHVINLTYIILFITYEGTFEGIYVHNIPECLTVNKKCPVHLVSFIKHHGLFVPYIDINFILFYF